VERLKSPPFRDVKAEKPVIYFVFVMNSVLLAFSAIQAGNHHDLYDIILQFEQMLAQLTVVGIRLEGLILNANYALKRGFTPWN